jgi:hypothetical protein
MAGAMMAGQYVGSQMWSGAREQQQLNQRLGQTFQFANAQGGRGFSGGEMNRIGGMMRGMTEQRGPGGEFVTMDEMGRLASNMGRMGMAQGVRNAKEFHEKFQQMMKTVKEVATTMSTSLEQAQEIMASMRGAGVFGGGRQAAVAGMIRQGAVAGGLATSELSQMANIGSQVSRAVGGRGQAGAVGGIRAISTVGTALQAGVISEEDVYNATGQTGAAGRQAMATNMLQGEARFFKSGLGRRVLAAMAQKGGTLDPEAVARFQEGNVGTGETMRMAYAHLGQVGRANFIRNEGRLRGEAVAAFGGMGRAQIAQGWLSKRGMSVYNMGDREMLFFQRKFKFDRDEADAVIKMARNMDRIKDKAGDRQEEDEVVRSVEQYRKNIGIEGVKRKFESAKQEVNNTLKQAGADLYEWGREHIERTLTRMSGDYARTVDKDLGGAIRDVMRYGADTETGKMVFGFGTKPLLGRQAMNEMIAGYEGGGTGEDWLEMQAEAESLRVGGDQWLKQNQEKMAQAGYKFGKGDVGKQLASFRKVQGNVARGRHEGVTEMFAAMDLRDMGGDNVKKFKQRIAAAMTGMESAGAQRLEDFEQVLRRSGPEGAAMADRYAKMSIEEKGSAYGAMAREAGVDDAGQEFKMPDEMGVLGDLKYATVGERREKIADYMFGKSGPETKAFTKKGWVATLISAIATAPTSPHAAGLPGDAARRAEQQEEIKQGLMGGEDAAKRGTVLTEGGRLAAAAYMERDENIALATKALMGDKEQRDEAVKEAQMNFRKYDRLRADTIRKGETVSDELAGNRKAAQFQMVTAQLASGQSKEEVLKNNPEITEAELDRAVKTTAGTVQLAQQRKRVAFYRRAGKAYRQEEALMGELTQEDVLEQRKRMKKAGMSEEDINRAVRAQQAYRQGVGEGAGMTGVGGEADAEAQRASAEKMREGLGEYEEMDTAALRKVVASGAGTPQAKRMLSRREALTAGRKSRKKGAGMQAIAGLLGGELGEEEAKRIFGMKDTATQAEALASSLGIEGAVKEGELHDVIEAYKKGDIKKAEKEFRDIDQDAVREGIQKKKEDRQDEAAKMNDPSYRSLTAIQARLEGGLKVQVVGEVAVIDKGGKDQPDPK